MGDRMTAARMGRLVGGLIALGLLVMPAAATAVSQGSFSCRASAIRGPVVGEPAVANAPYSFCRPQESSVDGTVNVPGILRAYVLDARTETLAEYPEGSGKIVPGGSARASVAYAVIGLPGAAIKAWGLSSTAGRKCISFGTADIGGSSVIAGLMLNGRWLPVSAPLSIPLGIGTLHINWSQIADGHVTTRALWLDLAGDANDLVLAEARGGMDGFPCGFTGGVPG
jgi:hypothetical protein